jgi:hypothetical protein
VSAGVTYYWQVRAVNDGGVREANDGSWWRFSTLAYPEPFDKLSPANGAIGQPRTLTLSWQASDGATNYRYCLDTTNNNGCSTTWISVGTALSASVSGLQSSATYYWQVEAENAQGGRQANGGWWQFTTDGPPAVFSKVLPANGATVLPESVTLTWQAAVGATSYRYCIDTTHNGRCDTVWIFAGTNQSASISGLAPTTSYSWQVEAENGDGITPANGGSWWGFTTDGPPAGFSKLLPANGAQLQPQSLSLTWRALAGATDYRYCVDTTNNNSCDTSWISVGTALHASVSGLALSTTYYWQVEAQNGAPTQANNGLWWEFSMGTETYPFSKGLPMNGATAQHSSLTLAWEVSSAPARYRICVDTSNNDHCDTAWTDVGAALSAALSGLAPSTSYYWQVEAQTALGRTPANGGLWWVFTTEGPSIDFTKLLPANGAITQSLNPTLTWQASSGADSYRYCLDTTNNNSCDTSWNFVGTALSAPISGLVESTTYFWQVEAENGAATQANGGTWWAFTTGRRPSAFSKIHPTNGATVATLSPILSWQQSIEATAFRYCVDTINNNSCDTAWTSAATALSTSITGLAPSTTYFWQVEADNVNGTTRANAGTWWAFTTGEPPAAFSKVHPAHGATSQPRNLSLSWQASGGADSYRYCVDKTNNSGCDTSWTSVGTSSIVALTGLDASTTYYWQVEAVNAVGATPANAGAWWAFTTATPVPSSVDDAYVAQFNTPLAIAAPGVLANDDSHGGGALTAALVSNVSNGTLNLAATGGFTYTPTTGFSGTDTFSYRAANSAGPGNTATVTLTVTQTTAVQPPIALYASSIVGNLVTLRWTRASSGPAPTGYVLEGGLNPGDVLASLPTGSAYPIFTFVAPTGAFYLRLHALNGTERSGASNEIRLFVNVAQPPSAPTHLLGMVNGSSLHLTWRNSYAGGTPSAMILDVTGPVVGSLPLPPGESFSFSGVPAGTYTLRLRAANGAGTSAASDGITLTFPSACPGPPLTPANFLAYTVGNTIHAIWDPADSGPAPTSFVVTSSGSFSGSFPTTSRSVRAMVPAGSYALSVSAVNACGASAPTPAQIVGIP